jgi:hypothetical protein
MVAHLVEVANPTNTSQLSGFIEAEWFRGKCA